MGAKQGMQTLEQSLARLVKQNIISEAEAMGKTSRQNELAQLNRKFRHHRRWHSIANEFILQSKFTPKPASGAGQRQRKEKSFWTLIS